MLPIYQYQLSYPIYASYLSICASYLEKTILDKSIRKEVVNSRGTEERAIEAISKTPEDGFTTNRHKRGVFNMQPADQRSRYNSVL